MMLQRARWAATAFAGYDQTEPSKIVHAVAEEAFQNAERFAEGAVEETGMGVVEHKRRKNEACSAGLVERYGGARLRRRPDRSRAQARRGAQAGRGDPGADAVDQPDRHRLLQGAAGADDAQRGRRLPAPDGPRGRRSTPPRDGPGGGRGRRAGRLRPGGRGADDPADRGADERPEHRRDRGHRRHRGGPGRLPLGQPGARGRARQRARARRRQRRRRAAPPSAWSTRSRSTTRSCAPTSRR